MPDDGSAQSPTVWPLPKFSFRVRFGSQQNIFFQEVSGLAAETQVIEYRAGNNRLFSTEKMPGLKKYGNVTLKKGVLPNGDAFWTWYNQIKMNTVTRVTVVIELLNETGAPTMTWTLANAWPTKVTNADLKSDSNEVAIELIELAHEGLTVANN